MKYECVNVKEIKYLKFEKKIRSQPLQRFMSGRLKCDEMNGTVSGT